MAVHGRSGVHTRKTVAQPKPAVRKRRTNAQIAKIFAGCDIQATLDDVERALVAAHSKIRRARAVARAATAELEAAA